jgi:hypothetical protein
VILAQRALLVLLPALLVLQAQVATQVRLSIVLKKGFIIFTSFFQRVYFLNLILSMNFDFIFIGADNNIGENLKKSYFIRLYHTRKSKCQY